LYGLNFYTQLVLRSIPDWYKSSKMIKKSEITANRYKELEERFPPVDPAFFLADQRAWVRRVNTMHDLTHAERSAAIFIAMMCSPDRPYCFAGMSYIQKSTGCERSVVYRACKKLVEAGLLTVESKARAGNIYIFRWPYA